MSQNQRENQTEPNNAVHTMFSIAAKNEPQTEELKQVLQICFSCPLDDQSDCR